MTEREKQRESEVPFWEESGYTPAFFVRVANKGVKSRHWTTVCGMTIEQMKAGTERSLARDARSGQTFFVECLNADDKGVRAS